jgi:hypothetical protein
MTPEEAVAATRGVVTGLAANFMLDGATYAHGASLGFSGIDFYVGGRGGVLGTCDADVVAAAFAWFNPEFVRVQWELAGTVMTSEQAADAFAGCCHRWAAAHIRDEVDCARLVELASRIVDDSSPAGAPVFAGWRRLPVPSDPKEAVVHQFNALRELRAGLHAGAVLATGMPAPVAMAISSPAMGPLFGWAELPEVSDDERVRWEQAEAQTNVALAAAFAVLSPEELDELVALGAEVGVLKEPAPA